MGSRSSPVVSREEHMDLELGFACVVCMESGFDRDTKALKSSPTRTPFLC